MERMDLFGEIHDDDIKPAIGKYKLFKARNKYRDATETESCKNCIHHFAGDYHMKTYHKCNKMGASHSEASDIRLKKVCNLWEK